MLDDLASFNAINTKLLNPPSPLRHVPLRVYIPSGPSTDESVGSFRVVQSIVQPMTAKRRRNKFSSRLAPFTNGNVGEVQTLGSALNMILPTLFPSRRDAIHAEPILHGVPVPFSAPIEDLMREAAYPDGWLHLCVLLLN